MGDYIPNLLLVFLQMHFRIFLHWKQARDVSPVGGITIYFGSLREGAGLQGGYN